MASWLQESYLNLRTLVCVLNTVTKGTLGPPFPRLSVVTETFLLLSRVGSYMSRWCILSQVNHRISQQSPQIILRAIYLSVCLCVSFPQARALGKV